MNEDHETTASGISVIPTDLNDTTTIPAITGLDGEKFGAIVPEFLEGMRDWLFGNGYLKGKSAFLEALREVIISRAREPATAAVLSKTIQPPFQDKNHAYLASIALHDVIMKLPLEDLQHYRQALETLASSDPVVEGDAQKFVFLKTGAEATLRFLNNPDLVWVHRSKGDRMAARTLQERIKTPEDLRPYVPELLAWLADLNWPPHAACWAALARFPEVTVGPIRELLQREKGDGGWISSVLEFVDGCVPVGELWEELRPQLQRLAKEPEGDEEDWDVADLALTLLKKLDAWEEEQKEVSATNPLKQAS